jgi:hypothetical protein
MKKTFLILFVLALVSTTGYAQQGKGQGQRQGLNKNCPGYVDANNDGVCDNLGTANCPYSKGQNVGRANRGQARGQAGVNRGQGMRNGNCPGYGRGQCRNFVSNSTIQRNPQTVPAK